MKSEIKAEWVRRLKKGDKRQITGKLFEFGDTDAATGKVPITGYCCLGVLVEQAIEAGVEGLRLNGPQLQVYVDDEEGSGWRDFGEEDLPDQVVEWAGLSEMRGGPGCRGARDNPLLGGIDAITRNDDNGEPFDEIAAAIEGDESL
jgi:hypothetical protein